MRILIKVFSFLIFLSLTANAHALDQDQVARLKRSVQEWNQWRDKNPLVNPNLEGADLQDANLYQAKLLSANLEKADLQGAINLTCEQINSVKILNLDTKFPDYLEVKITGKNQWTCKEIKKEK